MKKQLTGVESHAKRCQSARERSIALCKSDQQQQPEY